MTNPQSTSSMEPTFFLVDINQFFSSGSGLMVLCNENNVEMNNVEMKKDEMSRETENSLAIPGNGMIIPANGVAQLENPLVQGHGPPLQGQTDQTQQCYQCLHCSQRFSRPFHLKRHQALMHEAEFPFQTKSPRVPCKLCGKTFAGKLNRHIQAVHQAEKPFACSICGQHFGTADSRKSHEQTHESHKPLECHICKKRFRRVYHLKRHQTSAHGIQYESPVNMNPSPKTCNLCGKTLVGNLKRHVMTVHGSERLFSCSICDKRFKDKNTRNFHEKIHQEEKHFQCPTCSKRFRRRYALNQHQATMHPTIDYQAVPNDSKFYQADTNQNKQFLCPICHGNFPSEKKKEHMITHEPFYCKECDKFFGSWQSLSAHNGAQHTRGEVQHYQCPHCEKSFKDSEHLERHKVEHDEGKVYECYFCPAFYFQRAAQRTHELIHTG